MYSNHLNRLIRAILVSFFMSIEKICSDVYIKTEYS